ncbi:Coiled-coil domain-containing protein R3HCC1L [Portunus trituberculatus]|uniref:Coiled-coil domain-containing protein R3HCC1L n=1 Tax=Portunus trituberculatus TaxID=210409 RepID=A0A5B7E3D4_PORTR|nr:Coiled-coil domain-containing protein R3HCC1L [Portunus trituberculatus]
MVVVVVVASLHSKPDVGGGTRHQGLTLSLVYPRCSGGVYVCLSCVAIQEVVIQTASALLFPAVDPHHRYLIHSTVQDHFPALTSVSVGEGDQRRTAVSFRSGPSPPDSPLVGHHHTREEGHRPAGLPHHDLDRRKECMQPTAHLPKQEERQPQHSIHKQQQQQGQHKPQKQKQVQSHSSTEKPQSKVQQEVIKPPAEPSHSRQGEKQPRKEEKPQQRQTQRSRQAPRFRSHSSSSSHSRQRQWRNSVSPQHRRPPPSDATQDTSAQQGKATAEETHSKRRRNRKNKRQKEKAEQQEKHSSDHVNGREKHTNRQNTESGQSRHIETVTVGGQGKVSDNPNGAVPGRVTRRAEWTSSASVGEGGIRKKCKSVEESGVTRNNTRSNTNEEWERRFYSSGGSSSLTTSPTRPDPQAMPVTMPPEMSNNRRRVGKAAAQIYRPPPARGSHEEMSPAHHPHTPAQSRPSPQESLGYHTYPVVGRQRTDSECSTATNASDFYGKSRGRRPDQVLYVPRGRRHVPSGTSGSARATPTPLQDLEPLPRPPSPTYSICSIASEYSGRNRYGRQGSQASLFDGETEGRVRGKPPQAKAEFSGRETSAGNQRHQKGGNGNSRFSNETYQLIERCLNQDTESARSKDRPGPSEYHKGQGGRKSPGPPRDVQHSIHSKENIMAPQAESGRRAKKRRSRRRHSRSRDPSSEHHNRARMGEQLPRTPTPSRGGSGSEQRAGSCERVFYNSSYEHQDRGYDNYDRYTSSRTSSRNPSLERTTHVPNLNWRAGGIGGSNPMTPNKGSPPYCPPRFRNSSGKPPSGRLGSLPNVALDLGESGGPSKDTMEHCHTLPVHLPSTHREESSPCTTPANTTPSKSKQDTPRLSLDNSMTSSWGDSMAVLDISDVESPSQSQDIKTPSKESLNSPARSPVMSSEPSPCSSPTHPVESSIRDTADHSTFNQTNTDLSDTQLDHRDTSQANTDYNSKPDPLPTDTWEQNQTESPPSPREAPVPPQTEEHEKKASKKFAFNWADETEDSWDSLYDDSGECLDPDLKQQLNDTLGKVKLEKPVNDYCRFQPRSEAEMNEDDYAHVIEIYDFPTSFKTQDLMMVFSQFISAGFDVKWVDDTHALGIFSTSLMAAEALSLRHPFLKTRSLSNATKTSRAKAMRITDALLPYKPRPATSAALARRLVSGALGLKVNISREVREAERQKLKDAKGFSFLKS